MEHVIVVCSLGCEVVLAMGIVNPVEHYSYTVAAFVIGLGIMNYVVRMGEVCEIAIYGSEVEV